MRLKVVRKQIMFPISDTSYQVIKVTIPMWFGGGDTLFRIKSANEVQFVNGTGFNQTTSTLPTMAEPRGFKNPLSAVWKRFEFIKLYATAFKAPE
ncbi:hypothetical protein CEXT_79891 [Caerostris extrusa]|uniref:Uncharacterized protein n=1 Tax=Caerostris extrusa TaxID=172846 RepID=A0AAV4TCM4_CAEEX|nr:hypothetical protein CEXT_79891 [Caerostris extrusa]